MAASNTTHAPRWSNRESWFIVCVYCGWETIALLLSTLYSFSQPVVQEVYGVPSNQVATLGQSMQIIGNLFGVAVLSPLSDEYGRKKVTIASMLAYSLFNLGTAYAPNFITLIAFMFMSGFAWSTSLSFVPAVFSDLYLNRDDIGQPIALFVIGASVGPTLGVIVATALMEADVDLKWYFLVIVFGSAACTLPMLLVPETSTPKSSKTEEQGGNAALLHSPSVTPLKQANRSTADTRQLPGTHFFLTRVWVLLTTEPIMWITGVYNGLANGVFVLTVGGAITTLTEFKGLP
ncbi:oxalate formate antiporter [Purpureocillium lavendulum]|uniref:Oxalate formate antiporter n=1 Tax=Purpureocillium lavendulum TaxID=1247861 RepID=A0AB34FXC1_9HYPO|nr:oxalate formate antiporter [Purpureocillium lavendulum]